MRKVLTEIEKLDGRIPGLLINVKAWFDQGRPAGEIPKLLHHMYGVSVTETMAENYRCKRWGPEKESRALRMETTKAAIEAFGGDTGFDSFLLAKLWELMDKMTIPQLFAARSLFLKIRAQNLKEQEFLFKSGQLRPGQTSGGQEDDPHAQSRNALRRIKEIFGLASDTEPDLPPPHIPAAAGKGNSE